MSKSNGVQLLPGGICFAHGPYQHGYQCPRWPACATDPKKQEYMDMSGVSQGQAQTPPAAPTWTEDAADEIYKYVFEHGEIIPAPHVYRDIIIRHAPEQVERHAEPPSQPKGTYMKETIEALVVKTRGERNYEERDNWLRRILAEAFIAGRRLSPTAAIDQRVLELLEQIAGKNDLSGVSDDLLESAARTALYECEILAREAIGLKQGGTQS